MFDDNWIYIHDPSVEGWSRAKLPLVVARDGCQIPTRSAYGLEYFCFRARRPLGFELIAT